jgi:hypothetical protein
LLMYWTAVSAMPYKVTLDCALAELVTESATIAPATVRPKIAMPCLQSGCCSSEQVIDLKEIQKNICTTNEMGG